MSRIGILLVGFIACVSFCLNLTGCASASNASVVEGWRQKLDFPTTYTVQPGDTLYSIAWSYGLDYRQIAKANHLSSSYAIKVGQKLHLTPARGSAITQVTSTPSIPVNQNVPIYVSPSPAAQKNLPISSAKPVIVPVKTNNQAGILWAWPATGRIIHSFCPASFNNGVDIAGCAGSPVLSAAAGKVVYAGDSLRGYGELIIIKHSDEYLSAYAHNEKILVQEGQSVRVGQVIALMGNTEAKQVELHFEIRKAGKPTDPLKYLP